MNFKGKRFCQAPENLRGSLNFLHKQVFRHCSLLCIPPDSLTPIFFMVFVCLAFLLVVVLLWVLFVCFKSFNVGSKEIFAKGSKSGTSPKPGRRGGGKDLCDIGCQQNLSLPPQILVATVSCSLLFRSPSREADKGESGKRVGTQKQLGKLRAPHSMPKPLHQASILVLLYKGQPLADTLLPTHHPGI